VDTNFINPGFTLTSASANSLNVVELDVANSTAGAPVYITLTAATESPIAIVYSTGANQSQDGRNGGTYDTQYEGGSVSSLDRDADGTEDEFDDITTWLSRPLLFNRMVTAGRLP
jgi:hypothetical protein